MEIYDINSTALVDSFLVAAIPYIAPLRRRRCQLLTAFSRVNHGPVEDGSDLTMNESGMSSGASTSCEARRCKQNSKFVYIGSLNRHGERNDFQRWPCIPAVMV
ncbi:hypothetical protein AB1N83_007993 [Pleurotus pulmonarius]